jgi:hypothetical protein
MASGLAVDPNHTDITNHYIGMGVVGGLLLMVLFIWLLVKGFCQVGRAIRSQGDKSFCAWTVGASLFAHAVTCLSVSYFDHSIMFLYLTLAATTATLSSASVLSQSAAEESSAVPGLHQRTGGRSAWSRRVPVTTTPRGVTNLRLAQPSHSARAVGIGPHPTRR